MIMLESYNLKGNTKYIVTFKIFTIFLLIWFFQSELLKNMHKNDKALNISYNRLLAKYEVKKDTYQAGIKKQYTGKGMYNNAKNNIEGIGPYSHLKKDGLSDLDAYKKSYKKRYSKKNALAKLECYYEKKVFDKIDYIYNQAEKMKCDKKSYKKKMYHKYGYGFIIFSLVPVLGLIIPLLFNKNFQIIDRCFPRCTEDSHMKVVNSNNKHDDETYPLASISEDNWKIITTVNDVFLYLSTIIVLFVVIYILIKVIKYERLKAGRGKMNRKEYFDFCKKVFKNERY
ncbi:Plasmodium exported protein, unknown function [Plasmodium vivax]|uniref:Variable surface protein Vir35 n=1 Tax=Plasmodium vivax TaxID=5855 RepID=A0A1G4EFW4_PLAVI|nr:Plasmodium exported protein, unknown function [Plasmodium vivax]VUZ95041.1 Plasmodium exported protein, unknown function [Plasmodium vivax]